jgi:hypothetical protein
MAINEELTAFVKDALGRGVPRAEIEEVLRSAGWGAPEVLSALGAFADVDFPVPVPRPRRLLSARDAFLYMTLFTTLYISAFNLGTLLFEFINTLFPDPTSPANANAGEMIRWSIASLIVAVPVFLWLSRLTSREAQRDSARRRSAVRRWLTYLTLFVAAVVLIGDVITLIFNGLGGLLPVGHQVRRKRGPRVTVISPRSILAFSVAALAITVVVAGLLMIESPGETRLQRLDERRIHDLREVSRSVALFWTLNEELPDSLVELADVGGVTELPADPESGAPYDYRVIDSEKYELCAEFGRNSERGNGPPADDFWSHTEGRYCFQLVPNKTRR